MGMSTHIQAFVPGNDPEFLKHKEILYFCNEKEVSLPKETAEYFNTSTAEYPESSIEEKLEINLKENVHYKEWSDDYRSGFEIDLNSLPKKVSKIRFYNSY